MGLLTDFLVAGVVPGTELTINFEAFLEGVLGGMAVLLILRLIGIKRAKKANG